MNTDTNNKERAIVVGVGLKKNSLQDLKESLSELEDLVYSAGGEVLGSELQILQKFNSASLMGEGKITEIKQMVQETNSSFIVVDHHLSGVQSRNLEQEIGVRVLDRSQLILDIFAQRAKSYEGKLQVELAQMLDQLPRMVGGWLGSLSRQAGGIGTRGPGESALELDRRRINRRVKIIRQKLKGVMKNRSQHRAQRKRQQIPSFALIGYTNSGKSSLLNRLTKSNVNTKDQVFVTLDPTTRRVFLSQIGHAVITDTVGFIRKLPTHLIDAFKATLEESAEADILLHVIDLSSPSMKTQQLIINDLIHEFKWQNKPIIHIFNKTDIANNENQFQIKEFPRIFVSAQTGQGIDKLKSLMISTIQNINEQTELYFPLESEYKIYELGKVAPIIKTEKASQGTICHARLTPSQLSEWSKYLVKVPSSG